MSSSTQKSKYQWTLNKDGNRLLESSSPPTSPTMGMGRGEEGIGMALERMGSGQSLGDEEAGGRGEIKVVTVMEVEIQEGGGDGSDYPEALASKDEHGHGRGKGSSFSRFQTIIS